ncbi:MAG: ABC transporter permease subunit [Candidatus Omnitrophica bacterium]|nr:ABC transporter permease subunit [Candidatus Omnitrophota bacterium]
MKRVFRTSLRKAGSLLLLIGLWECISKLSGLPGAWTIAQRLVEDFHQTAFVHALGGSLRRMAIGYVLVTAIGIVGGMALGRFKLLDEVLGGVAVSIHAIPGAAWVPLAILWFGATERAVIFTILLGATGIVIVHTDSGIKEVAPNILRAAKTMGAKGINLFWHVIVPAAIPRIVDGLRLAWAFGWRALMAGELLTSVAGLGQMLNTVAKARQLDQLLALMLLFAFIGASVDGLIFKRLEQSVRTRWGLA